MLWVKTYPELNITAMEQRKEKPLRLWYLLRHLDPKGEGKVSQRALYRFVREHDLYSRQTVWRNLNEGDGMFWIREGDAIYYRSLFLVANHLDVIHLLYHPVGIPLRFFHSIASLRSAFIGTLFSHRGCMISQRRLALFVDRAPRTVRRYLEQMEAVANTMISQRSETRQLDPLLAEQGYFRGKYDGHWYIMRRLANTYYWSKGETYPYGQNKYYKTSAPSSTMAWQSGAPQKRWYFDSPKAASRALERMYEGEVIYERLCAQEDGRGARLWQGLTMIEGKVVCL